MFPTKRCLISSIIIGLIYQSYLYSFIYLCTRALSYHEKVRTQILGKAYKRKMSPPPKDAAFLITCKELEHKSKDRRALSNLIFDEESRDTCSSKEPNKLKIS